VRSAAQETGLSEGGAGASWPSVLNARDMLPITLRVFRADLVAATDGSRANISPMKSTNT
jgi:hypothetical protein